MRKSLADAEASLILQFYPTPNKKKRLKRKEKEKKKKIVLLTNIPKPEGKKCLYQTYVQEIKNLWTHLP